MPWTLGRYRLERLLGEGGMGDVYAAVVQDGADAGQRVCVKIMKPALVRNPRAVDLFLREARHASRLRHPRIVRILEFGNDADTLFLAMELLDGLPWHDVAQRCWRHGVELPLEVVVAAAIDACEALHYAHTLRDEHGRAAGLVHRDISPDNLFLCRDGATRVLDFGIAKATTANATALTEMGELRGKLPYMPPEQVRTDTVGSAADLWALGVTLFYLSTAQRPFDRPTPLAIMKAIEHEPAISVLDMNPHLPTTFANVVNRCLQKEPAQRWRSARALRDALLALLPRPPEVDAVRLLLAQASGLVPGARRPMTAHAALPTWTAWPAAPAPVATGGEDDDALLDHDGPKARISSPARAALPRARTRIGTPVVTADESGFDSVEESSSTAAEAVVDDDGAEDFDAATVTDQPSLVRRPPPDDDAQERTVELKTPFHRDAAAAFHEQTSMAVLPAEKRGEGSPPVPSGAKPPARAPVPVWVFGLGAFVVTVGFAALVAALLLTR